MWHPPLIPGVGSVKLHKPRWVCARGRALAGAGGPFLHMKRGARMLPSHPPVFVSVLTLRPPFFPPFPSSVSKAAIMSFFFLCASGDASEHGRRKKERASERKQ